MQRMHLTRWFMFVPLVLVGSFTALIVAMQPVALTQFLIASTPVPSMPPAPSKIIAAAESGALDPHIRLTRTDASGPFLGQARQTFEIGDRITVGGQDGRKQVYAVRTIRALEVPVVAAHATTGRSSRLLLVTSHAVQNPAAKPLRFIVEVDMPIAAPSSPSDQQHHAL